MPRCAVLICLCFALVYAGDAVVVPALVPGSLSAVPLKPGYHLVKAKAVWKQGEFPIAFGVYLPAAYFLPVNKDRRFPLITTMHNVVDAVGGSEGGDGLISEGLALLMLNDIGKDGRHSGAMPAVKVNPRKDVPFVGLVPQCPKGMGFEREPMNSVVVALADLLCAKLRVDPDRCYLTGFSYGGSCSWAVGMHAPQRWAAIAPLSARVAPEPARAAVVLKNVGVYLGCGASDGDFITACRQMRDEMTKGKHQAFQYLEVKDGGHHCYQAVYGDPEFWRFLFARVRPGAKPGVLPVMQ